MFRTAMACTLTLMITLATTALGGEGGENRVSGTISLWGGSTPAPDFIEPLRNLVGARLQIHVPVGQSHHWMISPAVGYGYGKWKIEQTAPPPGYTDQLTASYWDTMLDFLYSSSGDDLAFSCGPGLFYSSMKLKETGGSFTNGTSKPYQAVGAQFTLTAGIPMGRTMELTGSLTERAGWITFEQSVFSESKYSATAYSTQFGIGLHVRF